MAKHERSDETTDDESRPDAGRAARFGRGGGSRDERGFVLVWTTLFLMVLLGFAALAVDLGHSYYVGQKEQNAADAAALAGAVYLPGDLAGAQNAARELAAANGFPVSSNVTVDAEQDPGDASELLVTIHQSVPTWFGKAIGFRTMDVSKSAVGVASGAATATPLDLVLILDRTYSMSPADLQNVKDASHALLESLDPAYDSVALGVTGPSYTTKFCTGGGAGKGNQDTTNTPDMTWMASPWPEAAPSTDYQLGGSLNLNSQLVRTIDCLDTSLSSTDLGDPISAAQTYFATYGRPGVPKAIMLMTDGAANRPQPKSACQYANNYATQAKAAGIEIITIGFGVEHAPCSASDPEYPGSNATALLANMASPINGVPAKDDNDCTTAAGQTLENTDGDNFFCPSKSSDLSTVFVAAGNQLTADTPRLVR